MRNINNDGKMLSLCKFGSFLCPKKNRVENPYKCVSIDTEILDNPSGTKPILKICPPHNLRGYNSGECITKICKKDEDCFSGMCQNGVCITNFKSRLYDLSLFKYKFFIHL